MRSPEASITVSTPSDIDPGIGGIASDETGGTRKKKRWRSPLRLLILAAVPASGLALLYAIPPTRPLAQAALDRLDTLRHAAQPVIQHGAAFAFEEGRSPIDAAATRFASKPEGEAATAPVRGVRVTGIRYAPVEAQRRFTGVVAARWQSPLAFRVGGRITERSIEIGQRVKSGDVLFRLDASDYEAGVRVAEADLAAVLAVEVQATAEQKRQADLLAKGFATRAVYDRALSAAASANELKNAATEKLQLASNQRDYAILRAPHDGIVTAIRAEAGEVVASGQPVVTLVRGDEKEALVAIPEADVADLPNWTARLSLWAEDGVPQESTLREISAEADPASRTYGARYRLPSGLADKAVLGMSVTATLVREEAEPAASVPGSAIFYRDGKPFVWRVNPAGDRVSAHSVSLDALGAKTARIRDIPEGSRIVTLGVHRLDEGMPIRVIEDVRVSGLEP